MPARGLLLLLSLLLVLSGCEMAGPGIEKKGRGEQPPHQPRPAEMAADPGTLMQRWTFSIHRKSRSDILILATVFDPKGDPVLTEFALKQTAVNLRTSTANLNLSTDHIAEFSVERAMHPRTEKFEQAYVIRLKPDMYGPRAPDLSVIEDELFRGSLIVLFDDGTAQIADAETNPIHVKHSSSEKFGHKEFQRIPGVPVKAEVFEQGTVNPVPLEDYFRPKDISLPPPDRSTVEWNKFEWAAPPPAALFVNQPDVNGPQDLKLEGRLIGEETKVWRLLQMTDKPTIAEFLKAVGGKPSEDEANPFREYAPSTPIRGEIESYIPKLIAQFEKAYPDAEWYGLGRDIYLLNDILDAYYTHRGEPGRVHRLGASAPSFDQDNIAEVVEFLKSNGFDFENITAESRPRVFFDITSYAHDAARYSQSSQLMRAAYREWARLDRDPLELMTKLNFISTGYARPSLQEITPEFDLNKFISETNINADGPERILYAANSNSLQYSSVWHGVYQRFQKEPDGRTVAPPGLPEPNRNKLKLLWELWEIAGTVMNDGFASKVDEQRRVFGLECEVKLRGTKKP